MNKTFVFHDEALGDLLLSLPVIKAIRDDSSFVHLCARPDVARLMKTFGYADEISDPGSAFYLPLYGGSVDEKLSVLLNDFSRAVVFTEKGSEQPSDALKNLVPDLGVIFKTPRPPDRLHATDYRIDQALVAGMPVLRRASVHVPHQFTEMAREMIFDSGYRQGTPIIVVHPGSGWSRKNWPVERYIRLLAGPGERHGIFVILLSGPAEERVAPYFHQEFASLKMKIAHFHAKELALVAALLSICRVFIGNDSGIAHLAAAAGAPVLALFGPSDPAVWAPRGRCVKVIAAESTCAPCGDMVRTCGRQACLEDIAVEQVLFAATEMLRDAVSV